MAGWGEYIAACAVFLLTHAIPVRPPVKPWIVARLGASAFGLAYSALSIMVLVWLIGAAARAPFVQLWPRTEWQNQVTLAVMALACLILVLAAFRPNPFSFGGWRNEKFDPANPGIIGLVRRPVLAALGFWSLGHLVPNGYLAHVVMFGSFALFAVLGMVMIDRRRKRVMGAQVWQNLRPSVRWRGVLDPLRGLVAVAVLLVLIVLHPVVIGVPAMW